MERHRHEAALDPRGSRRTLHATAWERDLIAIARGDHTRLGLAVLLKSFQLDGRFPATSHEVPASVVAFLAQQLALDPLAFERYDWWGRVIDDHRRLIRETLGVRAWANADTSTLIAQ